MDNPDNPTSVVLSDQQLLDCLDAAEGKAMVYLDSFTDDMLSEKPEGCRYTHLELILRQFLPYRHTERPDRPRHPPVPHVGLRNVEIC